MTVPPEKAPDEAEIVEVDFERGNPVAVNGKKLRGARAHRRAEQDRRQARRRRQAVLAENRLVGMKSRGVYETPGGTILYEAHKALEQICIERDTLHYKQQVAPALRRAGLQRPVVPPAARGAAGVHRPHQRHRHRHGEGAAVQGPGHARRRDEPDTRCTTRNSPASAWKATT